MFNRETEQTQKAGDNAQQIQAQGQMVIINNGITEERVRDIIDEKQQQLLNSFTAEGRLLGRQNMTAFSKVLLPALLDNKLALGSLSDPAFLYALEKAYRTASCTDSETTYSLLTKIILQRSEKESGIRDKVCIDRALDVVGQIDDEALTGLTLLYCITTLRPSNGYVSMGMSVLDNLYSYLCRDGLPKGDRWLIYLDTLDLVKISYTSGIKKLADYEYQYLDGYSCIGIKEGTETEEKAKKILADGNFSQGFLIKHELLDGYVRIPICDKVGMKNFIVKKDNCTRILTDGEVKLLEAVWDLYENNENLRQQVKDKFVKMWDSYESLKNIRIWWDSFECSFRLTPTAKVIAAINVQKYDSSIPRFESF